MAKNEPGYTFTLDRQREIITIEFAGYWTLETVEAYREARRRAVRDSGIPPSRLRLLVDRRGQCVQAQDVVHELAYVVADNASIAVRTAVLFDSVLHRRQTDRTAPSSMRTFDNEPAALAWLNERSA